MDLCTLDPGSNDVIGVELRQLVSVAGRGGVAAGEADHQRRL